MATVSLPSRVLSRKIKKFDAFFVKNEFFGILRGTEGYYLPHLPPGYAYAAYRVTDACL